MPLSPKQRQTLQQHYLYLTSEKLPELARTGALKSPVTENHCFQRIMLDNVCGGQWNTFIAAPAYQHMSDQQLVQMTSMCNDVLCGKADLFTLNRQSLVWRSKIKSRQLTLFT
jgi:hypothetical protein